MFARVIPLPLLHVVLKKIPACQQQKPGVFLTRTADAGSFSDEQQRCTVFCSKQLSSQAYAGLESANQSGLCGGPSVCLMRDRHIHTL